MRKAILISWLSISATTGYLQTALPDSVDIWASHFLDKTISDVQKFNENVRFIESMTEWLEGTETWNADFSKLTSVAIQSTQDKTLRIFTWFVLGKDGYHPQGLVQTKTPKLKSPVITRLFDKSTDSRGSQFKTLNSKSWLGALYYDMVPFKVKGKKYHALLGYNPGNGLFHRKIIDIVQIMNNGQPRFGAPVFEKDKKFAHRIILEYDARAKVTLRYLDDKKMFVFDHLIPSRPELVDQIQHYVPDMSYDAFELAKNGWQYKADIDARNATEEKGNDGNRLVIDGVNDQNTLEQKSSGTNPDKQ